LRHRKLSLYLTRCYPAAQEGVQNSDSSISENNSVDPEQRAKIDELRNVSRLSPNHYKQYHGQPPDLPYKDLHRRKMLYAHFGACSGEDPRILWPTRAKLLDQEQEEQEEGCPLSERLAKIQAEKEEAERAKIERRKLISKNMSQMPKWIEEFKKKQQTIETAAKEKAAKKEALLEEARDYFGYNIQANDPKFKQMLEERELQEKTEKKKRKKEEKLKRIQRKQQPSATESAESKES